MRLIKSRNQRYSDFGALDRPDKLILDIVILFEVGDKLKIVPMLTKSVKGSSAKVLKLSLMALRPCYQFSPLGELISGVVIKGMPARVVDTFPG